MKAISIIVLLLIVCFFALDIYSIWRVSYQFNSPLISGDVIEKVQRPYIYLAIVEVVVVLLLVLLNLKSRFKLSATIGIVAVIVIFILRQYCLL